MGFGPVRLSLIASLVLPLAAACESPPNIQDPRVQTQVNFLLAEFSSKQQLSQWVGASPALCVTSSTATELCEWRVSGQMAGWRPLADVIMTGDRLNLICELPVSGEPRAHDACSAHPRRSNRHSWKIPNRGQRRRASSEYDSTSEIRARYQWTVGPWIAKADTLVRMSRLMGAIPDQCTVSSETEQNCLWRTTGHTYGHGTLAMWIGASKSKKIRLRCVFTRDGSPRAPESCFAQVGA